MNDSATQFWNDPECVEMFAARDPDHRLVELAAEYDVPASIPVLDLGCAGGRNAEFLAQKGFDLQAVDFAESMVERTRARIAEVWDAKEAERRVHAVRMDDLSRYADASFELVVALGIYQQAQSEDELRRSLAESARVLRPAGRCLVANFGPGTTSSSGPTRPVDGTAFVFDGFRYGRSCLLGPDQLDTEFAEAGLFPAVSSRQVERETEGGGRRVTVNALYQKRPR